MTNGDFLFRSVAGTDYHVRGSDDDRSLIITGTQEVDHILDHNARLYTHNDGYSPSRELRRVGSIPMTLLYLWKTVEGWDPFNPDNQDRLKRKLNDGDYLKLRTAPGRL